ncbi:LytTR family DNA-binding domain-containing protein [Maricaulis sp. MIT060901]|uniref:LytTR family DNA-binding domain-containing protein n=1 Tax=Maricaulis sp. MIT060901 TaxID=3096993 RepID=UPI00399B6D13
MSDEWLKRFSALRPGLELGVLMLAVLALLVLGTPTAPPPANHATAVHFIDEALDLDQMESASWPEETTSIYRLPAPETLGWVLWRDVELEGLNGPLAVRSAGPFSGRIYWNGVLIGEKGSPAATSRAESPGRIDAVFSIPPDLIRESGNQLLVEFSSHRAGYEPMVILQALAITPYRADDRRPLRAYFPLVLTGGALLALAVGIAWLGRSHSDPRAWYLASALAALFLAGGAEVSRAFINYTYDWHQPRQAAQFGFLLIFGLAQLRFAITRWPSNNHAGLALQAGSMIAITLYALWAPGYDAKSSFAVAVALFATATWLGLFASGHTRWLSAVLAVIAWYALRLPGDFLDRAVYALMLAMWGYLSLRLPDLVVPKTGPAPTQFKILTTGRMIVVDRADIVYLRAAGNYTEVHLANGGQHLDNRSLATLTDALAGGLHRLHRSYSVNLEHVSEVKSETGSKYTARLSTGAEVPVSRKEVKAFRELLARTSAA